MIHVIRNAMSGHISPISKYGKAATSLCALLLTVTAGAYAGRRITSYFLFQENIGIGTAYAMIVALFVLGFIWSGEFISVAIRIAAGRDIMVSPLVKILILNVIALCLITVSHNRVIMVIAGSLLLFAGLWLTVLLERTGEIWRKT